RRQPASPVPRQPYRSGRLQTTRAGWCPGPPKAPDDADPGNPGGRRQRAESTSPRLSISGTACPTEETDSTEEATAQAEAAPLRIFATKTWLLRPLVTDAPARRLFSGPLLRP